MKTITFIICTILVSMPLAGCINPEDLKGYVAVGDDPTPRISMWSGKVNQHNEDGIWMTDPDGVSGADIGPLEYCQKFWPDTVIVKLRPLPETITFYTSGNSDAFISSKEVWECILDADKDGIADSIEGTGDDDGDGTPNYQDLDSDGDNISDEDEGISDHDGDGVSDYLDNDSDGDGIEDQFESTNDTDEDGIPDYLDEDSDNDGIPDQIEGDNDTDGDGQSDYLDEDSDNDGHNDENETNTDTDNDGVADYIDEDSDGDGNPDINETGDQDGDSVDDRLESDDEDKDDDGDSDQNDSFLQDLDGDGIIDNYDDCPETPSNTEVNGFGCEISNLDSEPICEVYYYPQYGILEVDGIIAYRTSEPYENRLVLFDNGDYSVTLYCADPNNDIINVTLSGNEVFQTGQGNIVKITENLTITEDSPLSMRWDFFVIDGDSNRLDSYIFITHMMESCDIRFDNYMLVDNPDDLPNVCPNIDETPRISFWHGKVNQHNENGTWLTDPDGTSGANLDMLEYCQKWWPDSIGIELRPWVENIIFYTAGNTDAYANIKPVYDCIQYHSDDTPRISYWHGKVNQHNENGTWLTDPDGVSGASIDMLEYCQKWWSGTESVSLRENREIIVFWTSGNTDPYESTRDVYDCVQSDETVGITDGASSGVQLLTERGSLTTSAIVVLTSLVWLIILVLGTIKMNGTLVSARNVSMTIDEPDSNDEYLDPIG